MSRIAIAFFSVFLVSFSLVALEKPFWDRKPGELPKILKDRKIPVAVKSEEKADGKHHLRLQGIGEVSAPFEYTKKWTTNFNQLARVSDYAREVKWSPLSRRLYLHTEAFGYHARMRLKVDQKDSEKARELNFQVVGGVFTGMKGVLKVHDHGFSKSLVSIDAHYDYTKWVLPKLFLEFGLEVVLQKFAGSLRALIEKDFKGGRPAKPDESKKPVVEKSG